jgi:integrase
MKTAADTIKFVRIYRDSRGKWRVQYRYQGRAQTLGVFASKREATSYLKTSDFKLAFDQALSSKAVTQPVPSNRYQPTTGTLKALVLDYFKSPEFLDLDPGTQGEKRRLGEAILLEPTQKAGFLFGDYPADAITDKHVRALMDRKKDYPNAANHRRKFLSSLFNWALQNRWHGIQANPTVLVKKRRIGKNAGHKPWTDEDCRKFEARHPIGTMARLAYELFYCTGQRISDVYRFGRQHVKGDYLCFMQKKNEKGRAMRLELLMPPRLMEALNAVPGAWDEDKDRFIATERGKSHASPKALANKFKDWIREAGLGDRDISAHGLRHHTGNMLADNEATEPEIAAVLGVGLRTAAIYVKAANQRRNAARALSRAHGTEEPTTGQSEAGKGHVRHFPSKTLSHAPDFVRVMAVPAGLEPATFAFEARCSIR